MDRVRSSSFNQADSRSDDAWARYVRWLGYFLLLAPILFIGFVCIWVMDHMHGQEGAVAPWALIFTYLILGRPLLISFVAGALILIFVKKPKAPVIPEPVRCDPVPLTEEEKIEDLYVISTSDGLLCQKCGIRYKVNWKDDKPWLCNACQRS